MPTFSDHFELPYKQAELDFFDCDPTKDRRLYVDPYAISVAKDHWSQKCQSYMDSYFRCLLDILKNGSLLDQIEMTSHFSEPGDTFIGQSAKEPQGRGIGKKQSRQIRNSIKSSAAFKNNALEEISELTLYVFGVDNDKISDLTTNVIRDVLYEYTIDQCELHDLPMEVMPCPPYWDITEEKWISDYRKRPSVNGKPILLIPKRILRRSVTLRGKSFYNRGITDFLVQENLTKNSPLVKLRADEETRYVNKGDVREKDPFSKDYVGDFVTRHPDILAEYKKNLSVTTAGDLVTICTADNDTFRFSPRIFADTLVDHLRKIPTGREHADKYHEFMLGLATFLFYPHLTNPRKEGSINDGRKRIDIFMDNTSERGVFRRAKTSPNLNSMLVPIECKNYSSDIANPELDQLAMRFHRNRGMFGILLCRSDDIPDRTLARCNDIYSQIGGAVVVLYDLDLIDMLENYDVFADDRHLEVVNRKLNAVIS